MSQFSFGVKDFKKIKVAAVNFGPGISMIYGSNGNGKSTLIKAIKSVLDNAGSDSNCRHTTTSYAVAMKVDGRKLIYTRNNGASSVKLDDEKPLTKLGKGSMANVVPTFPFKRIDYEDSIFYPNFVFQNGVPLFDDIDATKLFASMFSEIARVSGRVDELNRDRLSLGKERDKSVATCEAYKKNVTLSKKALVDFDALHPTLESDYAYLSGLNTRWNQATKRLAEWHALDTQCSDSDKQAMVGVYDSAVGLFPALELRNDVGEKLSALTEVKRKLEVCNKALETLNKKVIFKNFAALVSTGVAIIRCQHQLSGIKTQLESLPIVNVGLMEKVIFDIHQRERLVELMKSLAGLPEVDSDLLERVNNFLLVNGSLAQVNKNYEVTVQLEDDLRRQCKEIPCERVMDGTCPYQEQLKIGSVK
jgi:energy-coupling factor transporter ATP-binding protein EcfA2